MSLTLVALAFVTLLFGGVVGAEAGPESEAPECAAEMSGLEAAVAEAPDDLFLGARYRQVVIRCDEGGKRATKFFDRLVKAHPRSAHAWLNAGLAHVDRIPTKGDIRQALLGRGATQRLGRSIDLQPTWVAHYVRGFVYLFYPRVFKVSRKAVADLDAALAIQAKQPLRPCHARTFVALGDAWYWRLDDLPRARLIWAQGLERFPNDPALVARVAKEGMPLRDEIRHSLDADRRVDTSLRALQAPPLPERPSAPVFTDEPVSLGEASRPGPWRLVAIR